MDSSMKLCRFQCHCLLLLLFFLSCDSSSNSTNTDYMQFIYKSCGTHLQNDELASLSPVLSALFQDFLQNSLQSKFLKTSAGDEKLSISGLFQCRGDLKQDECHNCISSLSHPALSSTYCGESVSARVQLSGCYLHYQTDYGLVGISKDHDQETTSRLELLHKECGERKAVPESGFKESRDAAFAALENGVVESENGFFEKNCEAFYVMAQCAGLLGGCDCGECVKQALLIAHDECEDSVSGKVFMDNCFISYSCTNGDGYPSEGTHDSYPGGSSSKVIAIAVGGILVVAVALAICYSISSCGKKKDDF